MVKLMINRPCVPLVHWHRPSATIVSLRRCPRRARALAEGNGRVLALAKPGLAQLAALHEAFPAATGAVEDLLALLLRRSDTRHWSGDGRQAVKGGSE